MGKSAKATRVKVLGMTYHDINHLVETRGIRLGPTEEQISEAQETAKNLNRHMKL